MYISPYSILAAVFWGNVCIVLLHFLRNRKGFILSIGILPLIILSLICVFRTFTICDSPFTYTIFLYDGLPRFVEPLMDPLLSVEGITGFRILGLTWFIGTLILLAKDIWIKRALQKQISALPSISSDEVTLSASNLINELDKQWLFKKLEIKQSSEVSSPLIYGYLKPVVIFPNQAFSKVEIDHILRHEFNHFINHDIWIKEIINLLHMIFWWNPLIHLFKADLNHILEMHSDLKVISKKEYSWKVSYLETLLVVARMNAQSACIGHLNSQLCGFATEKRESKLKQRFDLILSESQKNKKYILLTYLGILLLFIASNSIVIQPAWNPPDDPGCFSLSDDCSNAYFMYIDNNTYEIFVDDVSYGRVYESEIHKPPFDQVEVRYPEGTVQ